MYKCTNKHFKTEKKSTTVKTKTTTTMIATRRTTTITIPRAFRTRCYLFCPALN